MCGLKLFESASEKILSGILMALAQTMLSFQFMNSSSEKPRFQLSKWT